jgi:hypothetical protein
VIEPLSSLHRACRLYLYSIYHVSIQRHPITSTLGYQQAAADAQLCCSSVAALLQQTLTPRTHKQFLCSPLLLTGLNHTHTHTHTHTHIHTHASYASASGFFGQSVVATVGVGRRVPGSLGDQDGHYHVLLPRFRRCHA